MTDIAVRQVAYNRAQAEVLVARFSSHLTQNRMTESMWRQTYAANAKKHCDDLDVAFVCDKTVANAFPAHLRALVDQVSGMGYNLGFAHVERAVDGRAIGVAVSILRVEELPNESKIKSRDTTGVMTLQASAEIDAVDSIKLQRELEETKMRNKELAADLATTRAALEESISKIIGIERRQTSDAIQPVAVMLGKLAAEYDREHNQDYLTRLRRCTDYGGGIVVDPVEELRVLPNELVCFFKAVMGEEASPAKL
jgi:hypothetical protein